MQTKDGCNRESTFNGAISFSCNCTALNHNRYEYIRDLGKN